MIRKIEKKDKEIYLKLAKEFYSTDAVLHTVPDENFENTFNELMRSNDYTECYILEHNGQTAGYALLSKSFSQEAGGFVIWIEEIYILEQFRCNGLGREFFKYINDNLIKDNVKRLRLEVEDENERAVKLYTNLGFEPLKYSQMIKE